MFIGYVCISVYSYQFPVALNYEFEHHSHFGPSINLKLWNITIIFLELLHTSAGWSLSIRNCPTNLQMAIEHGVSKQLYIVGLQDITSHSLYTCTYYILWRRVGKVDFWTLLKYNWNHRSWTMQDKRLCYKWTKPWPWIWKVEISHNSIFLVCICRVQPFWKLWMT